jgi:hypothetical protein
MQFETPSFSRSGNETAFLKLMKQVCFKTCFTNPGFTKMPNGAILEMVKDLLSTRQIQEKSSEGNTSVRLFSEWLKVKNLLMWNAVSRKIRE